MSVRVKLQPCVIKRGIRPTLNFYSHQKESWIILTRADHKSEILKHINIHNKYIQEEIMYSIYEIDIKTNNDELFDPGDTTVKVELMFELDLL